MRFKNIAIVALGLFIITLFATPLFAFDSYNERMQKAKSAWEYSHQSTDTNYEWIIVLIIGGAIIGGCFLATNFVIETNIIKDINNIKGIKIWRLCGIIFAIIATWKLIQIGGAGIHVRGEAIGCESMAVILGALAFLVAIGVALGIFKDKL